MNGVLFDSDVLIEVLRQRKPAVMQTWSELADSDEPLFYTPVSVAEIHQGMREQEEPMIELLFSRLSCLPLTKEVGREAGTYLRLFKKSHAIGLGDALIGATAVLGGLVLWTQNRKHFPMRGLQLFREPHLK